ncbi:unnamed protein product, partial [Nesidiocoris tenuis]
MRSGILICIPFPIPYSDRSKIYFFFFVLFVLIRRFHKGSKIYFGNGMMTKEWDPCVVEGSDRALRSNRGSSLWERQGTPGTTLDIGGEAQHVKSWTTTTITAGSSFSTYRARFQHLIFGLNFDSAVQKIRNFQTIGRRGEGHATGVTLTLRVTGQLRLSDRIIRLIRCTWPNDAKIIANCAPRIGSAQSLFESMECHSFVPDRCSIMIGLIKAGADWGPTVWPEERPGTTSSSCESFDSK